MSDHFAICYTRENFVFVRPRDLLMQQNAPWILEQRSLDKKYEIENKDIRNYWKLVEENSDNRTILGIMA